MKILYYDPFAGISGDMNMAALVDLGVDHALLQKAFSGLSLGSEFSVEFSEAERGGIRGTRCEVHCEEGHVHRGLADIERILAGADLAEPVRRTALAIFHRVAKAEAKVHDRELYEVHFHEVGAADSIADIVGAAVCFHALGVEQVWSAPIELGGGTVRCAHGLLPVPAPATVEILRGIPTRLGAVEKEATTPTGAAIIAELTDRFTARPAMTLTASGHGIGHRDNGPDAVPNLLRVYLAEVVTEPARVKLLCCNVDDMTGESLGNFMELAMAEGAQDCSFTAIQMKKNRPAVEIALLCDEFEEDRFRELLFRHTSTLGIKSSSICKTMLARHERTQQTPLGPVRFKEAWHNGKKLREKPEFEECRRLAKRYDLPLDEVIGIVRAAARVETQKSLDGNTEDGET